MTMEEPEQRDDPGFVQMSDERTTPDQIKLLAERNFVEMNRRKGRLRAKRARTKIHCSRCQLAGRNLRLGKSVHQKPHHATTAARQIENAPHIVQIRSRECLINKVDCTQPYPEVIPPVAVVHAIAVIDTTADLAEQLAFVFAERCVGEQPFLA